MEKEIRGKAEWVRHNLCETLLYHVHPHIVRFAQTHPDLIMMGMNEDFAEVLDETIRSLRILQKKKEILS